MKARRSTASFKEQPNKRRCCPRNQHVTDQSSNNSGVNDNRRRRSCSVSNFDDSQRKGKRNIQMALSSARRPGTSGLKGYSLLNTQTYLILKTSFGSSGERECFFPALPSGTFAGIFSSSFSDQVFRSPNLWRVKTGRDTIKSLIRRMKWSGFSITAS